MLRLWQKVISFLKKVFGIPTLPKATVNADALVMRWWDIYACAAHWLPYSFITSDGIKRQHQRRTLNPAKLICSEIARLVLAEPPAVTASPLVISVIEYEDLWTNMRKYTEYQAALGGMVIKARPEGDRIVLDFVSALNFIPLASDNRRVTEASFIDRRVDGDKTYIRLETYRKSEGKPGYTITSKAFQEESGQEISLDRYWPGVPEFVELDIDVPPFVYFANPEANNIDPESPLGISTFHNAQDTLQALDIAFDEFCWEVESGARKLAIPGVCMRRYLDEQTGEERLGINPGDRVFVRLEGDDAEKFKPTDLTSDIRTSQFVDAINFHFNLLSVQCHFDAGYFSFDGKSVKTATEIISENSHTYKMREDYRAITDKGLKALFDVIDKLGIIYKIAGAGTTPAALVWDDGIIEDRNSRANYHASLYAQQLEDRTTALKAIHGVDDKRAAEMGAAIDAETPKTIVDPFGIGR
jgi:A118 family predicted phage portal protein